MTDVRSSLNLTIELFGGLDRDPVDFKWEPVAINSKSIKVELEFEVPLSVSPYLD